MSKSYSNKALPSGTILREWRLEEVLGVGGFGIVYKGRGIYFDELVAIKEYFPSSISERKDGDTVVPIDSDAEEVHALGLKKFVEEAKLLWNLSTPTRHPNIVSVRSLFEIHGTAYMVMDFEDGVSLSHLLKGGRRFNEASLMALIKPVAEGLDRAHRVGVLHRDIKPPNILVNEDGRPVLIDFGSARFESGEATSTKVTFHTPPYAAIEQYVKTYAQGPWTDIYALGVVLYECVAGEKPPEVLERLHGGLGKPLADGDWPGYSRQFLRGIDAAMTIRPDDRPQSIGAWLAMFEENYEEPAAPPPPDDDEDATRIATFVDSPEDIVPVAPPPPGFGEVHKVDTPVPDDTSQVQFKRAGQDTNASKKTAEVSAPSSPSAAGSKSGDKAGAKDAAPSVAPKGEKAKPAGPPSKRPLVFGGAALAMALLAGGGWYLSSSASPDASPDPALQGEGAGAVDAEPVTPIAISGIDGLAPALSALAADAKRMGAPSAASNHLTDAAAKIAAAYADFEKLTDAAEREAAAKEMEDTSRTAAASFASALLRDVDTKRQRLVREQPWANPANPGAAADQPPKRQKLANSLRNALSRVRSAASGAGNATEPGAALSAAGSALAGFRTFTMAYFQAFKPVDESGPQSTDETVSVPVVQPTPAPAPAEVARPLSAESGYTVPSAKLSKFNSIVSASRGVASDVIAVRRQNIWRNSRRKVAEGGPRLWIDIRRRAFGAASADVRWSVV